MFNAHLQDNRPQATAHLAKTMGYLQLSAAELEAALLKEVDQNPALEIVDELRCPGCGRRLRSLPCPTCAAPAGDGAAVVFLSPRQPAGVREAATGDDDFPETGMPDRLDEYILRQIGPALSVEERPVAAYILAQLDENGLFAESPAEIAMYKRVPLRTAQHVLDLIQHADPPGVGARTPQESLLIQLAGLANSDTPVPGMLELARLLIAEHFEALGKMEYERVARRLRTDHNLYLAPGAIETAVQFIHRNLTPYPARAFWGEGKLAGNADGAALSNPDVNITLMDLATGGGLSVEVFAPLSGWLRVNPEFKAAITEGTTEEREKWSQTLAEAALVTKCLQQRNHTMRRLMQMIAEAQREFILGGDGDLRPTTRVQLAQALGLHESTISRAVAGKSVALPDGRVVPLAKFFDRSLSVRDRVRCLIEAESRPLTDDDIAEALAEQGIQVARRTVAKYRKMLGILPANVRTRQARAQRAAATSLPRGRAPLPARLTAAQPVPI
jgi:RNA polymerase sigma-54 factor